MTIDGPTPIVSGRVYTVVEVSGRPAAHLDDFTGTTSFVLEGDGESHVIPGVGATTTDGVRFHQKDPEHHGKDVRIWNVTEAPEGAFVAQHDPAI
jgi:hypothetical protein